MHESQVSISECDNVKSAISDPDSDRDDQEYLVLNSAVEIIQNEEERIMDPNVLMSSKQSLHKEVIQLFHEKQDEIFVQVCEKVPLDEFMVGDRNDNVGFQETSEVSFLLIDECNQNLAVISNEGDQNNIQTTEYQNIQDCLSDSFSYVSCFAVFFEKEI